MLEHQAMLPLDSGGRRSDDARDETAWTIRASTRARRLALRVHLDGRVEVVVPRGVSASAVSSFVQRHREWVRRKLDERPLRAVVEPFPPEVIDFEALGQRFRVHLAGGRARPRVRRQGVGVIALGGDWGGDPSVVRRALLEWLVKHVHEEFEGRLRALSAELGLRYSTLKVRRQRTRWGSCSARGVISLNVCAAFQSPEALRYLMIHELAHTRHMNHSAAFWQTVSACCPDYRRLDRQLLRGWQRVPAWVFG